MQTDETVIDEEQGVEILGQEIFDIMLVKFKKEFLSRQMVAIEAGMKEKDWPTVNVQSHSLKGAANSICAPGIAEYAKQVQEKSDLQGSEITEHQFAMLSTSWEGLQLQAQTFNEFMNKKYPS
jgi:HPt (histidine-containing phosphotransfer) domain-containing protein